MPSERQYGLTEPAPRCDEHAGLHARYLGRCVAVGAQVPRPFMVSGLSSDCPGCGVRVYTVVATSTLHKFVKEEATGEEHHCPPAIRVQLDETALASALAGAFDEVRRRRERPSVRQQDGGPVPPALPSQAPTRNGLGSIPRLDQ